MLEGFGAAVRGVIGAALLLLSLAARASAQGGEAAVEYTVVLREPQTQMVEMTMSVRGVRGPALEVCLPVWRPGRYQVLDFAGAVRDVRATNGGGEGLRVEKADKSRWIVRRREGDDDEVIVSYRVYCNSIGDRTRHVDGTHAFLSPASLFMYAPEFRGRELRVRVVAPEGWDIATGLERDPADGAALVAPDYDVLVDSPLEVGLHERLRFDVEGVPHEVVIWNPTGQARTLAAETITGEIARVVRGEREVFGEFPYSRYVFLVHAYPGGGGGTEHLNSTIMGCSPAAFREADALRRFVGLVAHEYFHTWNVKQLRPAGLKPYDYQHENYSDLLWMAEGMTSYMDQVCLVRVGLTKPDDYLRSLSGAIDGSASKPGYAVQSAAESSLDAWVKFNKPNPDSANSTVSFYEKGSLVSFLLDMVLRAGSGGRESLDTLLRGMYREFPLSGPGYTSEDLERAASRLAGKSLRSFFDRFVSGTEAPDYEAAAAVVGLELVREGAGAGEAPERRGRARGAETDAPRGGSVRAYIGLNLEVRDGMCAVTSALADGPAYAAGLAAGDVIVAANGQRLRSGADLDAVVRGLKPGQPVRLAFFRYDTLREVTLELGSKPEGRLVLRRVKSPTDEQKAAYASWLGQAWPGGEASEVREPRTAEPSRSSDETYRPRRRPSR